MMEAAIATLTLDCPEPLKLKKGGSLTRVEVAYQTMGQLNADASNAILICHPLTMDASVGGEKGWWSFMVGPGRPVDTNSFFVICTNVLGGCMGTTGPLSINPSTGIPYRTDFPEVCIRDMVEVQKRVMDHFSIECFHAVIGGSLGGMQALEWSVLYPDKVKRCIAIATGVQLSSQGLAFDVVGRACITSDPAWRSGHYEQEQGETVKGLALARMIGHITYISKNIMEEKFGRKVQDGSSDNGFNTAFAVESFLRYNSEKFIQRFDPNAYLYLTKAMDTFDITEGYASLDESLKRSSCDFLVISFSSDWLFRPSDSIEIANSLARLGRRVTYADIETELGHDAFLIDGDETRHMTDLVNLFLADA
jgi:homoserine O-acetyltransferase